MSIFFFYGDEDYNIELEINKLKSKNLDKNFSSMNFKSANNPPFADLISHLRTQPMMFGNQMILINCSDYFSRSWEDSQIKEIESTLKNIPESLFIIFVNVLPRDENKKIDTRRKFYKVLTKYAQTQEFPAYKNYNVKEISAWIKKNSKKFGITFSDDACSALIENIGSNLRELSKEMEKLQLSAYPKTEITRELVKEVCISNEDLFACTNNLLKSDKTKAIAEFRKLTDKKHPLEIITAMNTIIKNWLNVKLYNAKGKSNFEIAKLVNMHEYRVKLTLEQLKNTPLKSLVKLKQNLTQAEFNMKSGNGLSGNDEIEIAFLKS